VRRRPRRAAPQGHDGRAAGEADAETKAQVQVGVLRRVQGHPQAEEDEARVRRGRRGLGRHLRPREEDGGEVEGLDAGGQGELRPESGGRRSVPGLRDGKEGPSRQAEGPGAQEQVAPGSRQANRSRHQRYHQQACHGIARQVRQVDLRLSLTSRDLFFSFHIVVCGYPPFFLRGYVPAAQNATANQIILVCYYLGTWRCVTPAFS